MTGMLFLCQNFVDYRHVSLLLSWSPWSSPYRMLFPSVSPGLEETVFEFLPGLGVWDG
jgi:hypothetical protein